jgi:hypothetical protein
MNKAFRLEVLAFLLLSFGSAASAASDWRPPDRDELGQHQAWRENESRRYLIAKVDLDGDAKEDVARLLVHDKDGRIGLFVELSSREKLSPHLLATVKDRKTIGTLGIRVTQPGTDITACGKGYWDCEKNEPAKLRLKNPAIDFFQYEGTNSFFIWNTNKKKFDRIWMSD